MYELIIYIPFILKHFQIIYEFSLQDQKVKQLIFVGFFITLQRNILSKVHSATQAIN